MKKNTLIALFAILTLALGGCSEKAEPAADTTTTAETTTAEETTSAEETTEEIAVTEEVTEKATTEETTTTAPETTTEEVTTTEEITTTPETTPAETTTEEITTEVTTKAPEMTTEEIRTEETSTAAETTPAQEETNLDKVTYPTENYASIRENQVDIYPAEAWYEGEKFVVKCYVTNGFNVDKVVTSVPKFIITDVNGNEITNAKFDSIGVTVPAKNYIVHTFTFSGAALMNVNADYSNIGWSISTNFSDVSAPVTSLGTASQTIMGGKVKVTAEKKSNNTIVLTIENNFEKEVSTFDYPQIKVNGMTQDLDKHLQLQNGTQKLSVPAGEKGQITYYVSDVNSVEALIGSLHSMAPSVTDREFNLVF